MPFTGAVVNDFRHLIGRFAFRDTVAWVDDNCELLARAVVAVVAVLSIILVFGYRGDKYDDSPLYQSIDRDSLEDLRDVNMAIIAGYIPLVIVTGFEVIKGGLGSEEKRRGIQARGVIFLFTLVPRVLMYVLVFPNPDRLLTVPLHLNMVCRNIVFLFEYQSFAVFAAVIFLVARKGERFARPIYLVPLLLGIGLHSTMGQVLQNYSRPNDHTQLAQVYSIESGVFYLTGFVGLLIILNELWEVLVKGERFEGHRFDKIFVVTISFAWYCYAWFADQQSNAVAGLDRDYDVRFFIVYNSLGILVYSFVMFFHSTEVAARRVDLREKHLLEVERREQALQLTSSLMLHKERELSIKLLYSIVPPKVASDLAHGREVLPEMFDFTAIFLSDVKGFTQFSSRSTPLEVFSMLDRLYVVMDTCVSFFPSLYKVETCGDAFLVVGGIMEDEEDEDEDEDEEIYQIGEGFELDNLEADASRRLLRNNFCHANAMCQFSLMVRKAVRNVRMDSTSFVQIRIGIHCGPIITGVIGQLTPHWHVFGDTVNTASRMESTGETDRVHVSNDFATLVQHSPYASQYLFEKREPFDVKGKGLMQTYFLDCHDEDLSRTFKTQFEIIDTLVAKYDIGKLNRHVTAVRKNSMVHNRTATASVGSIITGGSSWSEESSPTLSTRKRATFNSKSTKDPPTPDEIPCIGSSSIKADYSKTDYMGLPLPLLLRRQTSSNVVKDGFSWATSSNRDSSPPSSVPTSFSSSLPHFSFSSLMADDFNVLSVDARDQTAITAAIVALFKGVLGGSLETAVQVEADLLWRFVRRIGTLYQLQPYHNFHHAFAVTRETARLLLLLGFVNVSAGAAGIGEGEQDKDKDNAQKRAAPFSPRELFTILLCAVVHDVDHPGLNNDFLIKSKSQLALVYNDNSVLENYHISLANNVLLDKAYNVFERWGEAERTEARRTITSAVLATDMAVHKTLQLNLEARAASLGPSPTSVSAAFDLSKDDDKQELVKIILHTADIFNPARHFSVSSVLAGQMAEECRVQVHKERSLGLQETSWMARSTDADVAVGEANFAQHVARPYFSALAACFPDNAGLNFVPAVDANVQWWTNLAGSLQRQQEQQHSSPFNLSS